MKTLKGKVVLTHPHLLISLSLCFFIPALSVLLWLAGEACRSLTWPKRMLGYTSARQTAATWPARSRQSSRCTVHFTKTFNSAQTDSQSSTKHPVCNYEQHCSGFWDSHVSRQHFPLWRRNFKALFCFYLLLFFCIIFISWHRIHFLGESVGIYSSV